MANCPNSNERLFGGAVVLEVAEGCSDVVPLESDWLSLAAGNSKGWDFSPNAVTSEADDGGGYVESIITNSDFTISFEGEVRKRDKLDQFGIGKFITYFAGELSARRQPGHSYTDYQYRRGGRHHYIHCEHCPYRRNQ